MRYLLSILIFYTAIFLAVVVVADRDWLCGEVREGVVKTCVGVAI